MIHSLLIGLVTGARSMTPLAAVSVAAATDRLPRDNGAPEALGSRLAASGAVALAVGEVMGDKLKSAPDRIVPAGVGARLMTGGLAGAALAPRDQRLMGATVGALAAVAASYVTFGLRMRALRRYGQTSTGFVEDALAGAAAWAIIDHARRDALAA